MAEVPPVPRVGVLGYGTIGRRVATAVAQQPDLQLVGVAGRRASPAIAAARRHGYRTYEVDGGEPMAAAPELSDFLAQLDVLLDCTPSGTPPQYRPLLDQFPDLVTIVQGGESAESCEVSFNSLANYSQAAGKKRIRVISCSSTGITRFLWALQKGVGVVEAFVTLARRAADPGKLSKVPLYALVPTMGFSHHARDVNTVLPGLRVSSVSVDCPTVYSHVLWFYVELPHAVDRSEVLAALDAVPRIIVGSGVGDTAKLAEHFSDLGRYRRDYPEIYVFADCLSVQGRLLTAAVSVHMESITIPETIDCIRAAWGLESDPWRSIQSTDQSLGIATGFRRTR